MHMQMTKCVWACGMLLLMCPCAILGQDAIDAEIRDEMMVLHPDVRMPGLAAIKRKYGLTDNGFSARLVKLATVTTNDVDSWLRGFTICAIRDFGTTNALDFLESEALCGGSSAGIKGYGLITSFDDRFFDLAEQILANKNNENTGRRDSTYRVFQSLMCSDQLSGRKVPTRAKTRAKEALVRHSFSDSYHRVLIDMILTENDFEEPSYKNSPDRLQIARVACDDPASSDYAQRYFKNVIQQIGYALPKAEELSSAKAVSLETGKQTEDELAEPTFGRSVGKVDSPTSSETVDADKPITHVWHIMMVCGVLLFALTFLVIRLRKRRISLRP